MVYGTWGMFAWSFYKLKPNERCFGEKMGCVNPFYVLITEDKKKYPVWVKLASMLHQTQLFWVHLRPEKKNSSRSSRNSCIQEYVSKKSSWWKTDTNMNKSIKVDDFSSKSYSPSTCKRFFLMSIDQFFHTHIYECEKDEMNGFDLFYGHWRESE